MSTQAEKRPLELAIQDACAFKTLFDGHYERWEIAGSVRRHKPEVGDIEHVVIPKPSLLAKIDELTTVDQGLFGVKAGPISKHVYKVHREDGTIVDQFRWGEKYRGCDFRGFNHEIFMADIENWGAILTIRTGPAEFSEHMVTVLRDRRLMQKGGYVVYSDGRRYPVATEQAFFAACGVVYIDPQKRTGKP